MIRNLAIIAILVALAGALYYGIHSEPNVPIPAVGSAPPLDTSPFEHRVMTTLFWIGEEATPENTFIANDDSFWDDRWVEHYGGVDDPEDRCGYLPCAFEPQENPFYIALPYGKVDEPQYKNQWVKITYNGTTCYGQWEDVGPFETDDADYVFGTGAPKNALNQGAGLDISPALWTCLGLETNSTTTWSFVEAGAVPDGPWRERVTERGVSWR